MSKSEQISGAVSASPASIRRLAQSRLSLGGSAASTEAKAFLSDLVSATILPSLPAQQRRPSSIPAIERAADGLIAGLALAAAEPWGDGWLRRPMSDASFTPEPVSRDQFAKVLRALVDAGLVETVAGFLDRSGTVSRGAETRVRLSADGWARMGAFGIGRDDVPLHYVAGGEAESQDREEI